MANIKPVSLIASISGKMSSRENAYLKTNKRTGSVCVSHYPKKKSIISDRQREAFDNFGNRSILASQWLEQNKPTPDNPMGTEAFQQMRRAFESQRKIGIWFSYVMKHLQYD
jgi:hypothetical protein